MLNKKVAIFVERSQEEDKGFRFWIEFWVLASRMLLDSRIGVRLN